MIAPGDVTTGLRFLRDLPGFLRTPLTVEAARTELARRLADREGDFLRLARASIYEHAASPYRRLLWHAGCEYGDLERLVRADGVEGALRVLRTHGVHVSVEEYKGRRPMLRGSLRLDVTPGSFTNPRAARHLPVQSSGSRGARTTTVMDLSLIRDHGVNTCLALDAWGGNDWVKGVYSVPGGSAAYRLLKLASFGTPVARWFMPVDPSAQEFARYRWSARGLYWASALAGRRLPRGELAPLDDPLPLARWMAAVVRAGRTPWVRALPSLAVRVCQAAAERGVDLTGAKFTVSGEPITRAKVDAIVRSGAAVTARYGAIESGSIGYACLDPEAVDDLHVFHDLHALIQPDDDPALLVTSLRPNTAVVMLNFSMGDEGIVRRRACGCPMERYGWTTHLHTVRSREKLTTAGMTFFDFKVVRVLEEILPARFGGGPLDYQLVEDELPGGRPGLRLLVHPRIGPVDVEQVEAAFLDALGTSPGERLMSLVWHQADVLRVERRPPLVGSSGKILHLRT
jgi:hypothetical protein